MAAIVFLSVLLFSSVYASMPVESTPQGEESAGNILKPASGQAGQAKVVTSVGFVGNRHYKDKVLQQRVDIKKGDRLDPVVIEAGRRTIAEIYRKVGFAFVKVTVDFAKFSAGEVVYTIDEGPRVRIASVHFSGNEAVRTSILRNVVKTQQKKWFYWPFYYTEETIQQDVERLQNFYYAKGFLDHQITWEKKFSDDQNYVYVTFVINEGPVYHVKEILFTGNEHFDEETLRAKVKLTAGDVYLKPKAEADMQRVLQLYRQNGFLDAEVTQAPRFAPGLGENVVNMEFSITEDDQFRIGRIEITGNETAYDRTVRRVLDEYGFTPGRLYDADMAPRQGGGKLERYVRTMLLAEDVVIAPVPPESGQASQKDVRVGVKEGDTGMISPGVAFSSDYGLMGQLVFEQRNFDISDWPESFWEFITMRAFRGGGQRVRIALQPGTQQSVYSVSFSDPYWRDIPISINVVGSSYGLYRESYNEGRLRGYLGFESRLDRPWRKRIGFRSENVDVRSIDFDAPKEIREVKGNNTLLGLKFGIGRSMTDDEYDPSSGYTFDTDYEQVTGNHDFGILTGSYLWYRPLYQDDLNRKTILAVKLQGGVTLSDAPPFEKFYAGGVGTYSIRGFRYRGVSPRGLQTNVLNPEWKDPIGSDWVFLANAEITVPLIGENFDALFFIDSGALETGPYRMAVGGGLQIKIPHWFGPIPMRFAVAYPLKKDNDDETEAFSFSMGRGLF